MLTVAVAHIKKIKCTKNFTIITVFSLENHLETAVGNVHTVHLETAAQTTQPHLGQILTCISSRNSITIVRKNVNS